MELVFSATTAGSYRRLVFLSAKPGDLVKVEWHDSSSGRITKLHLLKKLSLPVESFGIYIGEYGDPPLVVLVTEIYHRGFGKEGYEVNALVKSSVTKIVVLAKKIYDISTIKTQLDLKIAQDFDLKKLKFCVEVVHGQ